MIFLFYSLFLFASASILITGVPENGIVDCEAATAIGLVATQDEGRSPDQFRCTFGLQHAAPDSDDFSDVVLPNPKVVTGYATASYLLVAHTIPDMCRPDHRQLAYEQASATSTTRVRNIREELQQYKLTVSCAHGSKVVTSRSARYYGSATPVLLQSPSRDRIEDDTFVWLAFLAAARPKDTGFPYKLTAATLYEADDDDERADDDDDMISSISVRKVVDGSTTLSKYGMYSNMITLPGDLPTGDYELKIELEMLGEKGPYDFSTVELVTMVPYIFFDIAEEVTCDPVSAGALLAIAAYESRATQVRALDSMPWTDDEINGMLHLGTLDTMSHCFPAVAGMETVEWTPVTSYSSDAYHISMHATPDLATYLTQPAPGDDFVTYVNGHETMSVALSFRGTAVGTDWLLNSIALGHPCRKVFGDAACDMTGVPAGTDDDDDETPEVHTGLAIEYSVVRGMVLRIVRSLQDIERQLSEQAARLPDRAKLPITINVVMAGHSQGGALAQLAMFDVATAFNQVERSQSPYLRVVVAGVTLASPMVGDHAFARLHHSRLPRGQQVRVENDADAVPDLPTLGYTTMGTLYDVPCETEWFRVDTLRCHSATRYGEQVFKETAARPSGLDLPVFFRYQVAESFRQAEQAGDGDDSSSLILPIVAGSVGALCCCALLLAAVAVTITVSRRRRKAASAVSFAAPARHDQEPSRRSRAHSRSGRSKSRSSIARVPQ
jgi:hypothetical protein